LRPPIAYGLEAKQLGPQFYWSFSFGAAFSKCPPQAKPMGHIF